MGKGHYLGGGTLIGFGTTTGKSTSSRRGLNLSSGPADRQRAKLAEKKRRKQVADKIAATEKVVKKLSDEWRAEKGRKQYNELVLEQRTKTSPLAAALRAAMDGKVDAGGQG